MSRHVVDHVHSTSGETRVKKYLEIDRSESGTAVHPAIKSLHRREGEAPAKTRRAQEYARIERGRST